MTGSALFDFLISIVVLGIIGALFFAVIDKIAPDPTFRKIARIAVGGVLIVVFLFSIKAVLFGGAGGIAMTPMSLISFAIGAIVVIVVLYLIDAALTYFGGEAGIGPFINAIKYVIGAIALIALLVLFANAIGGGGMDLAHFRLGGR